MRLKYPYASEYTRGPTQGAHVGKKSKKGAADKPDGGRSIQNRRARYDYQILETYEAGVALVGSEVKSIFLGRAHLTDAYCQIVNGEAYLMNVDVEPYEQASVFGHERRRDRKLLLHRKEIDTLARKSQEKGLAIVPTRLYFKNGRVKAEIALGRGKAEYDKRDQIAKNEERREADRIRKGL
jgi:SsrA-binding protein